MKENIVTFQVAKLAKEKGFDKALEDIFYSVYNIEDKSLMSQRFFKNVHQTTLVKGKDLFYHAPTIAEIVMWLYEKRGIWICVSNIPFENHFTFEYSINTLEECKHHDGVFNSPTEAYEAAIEYTLKKLI